MRLGLGLTLLLGGARSGKSDLAVKLGQAWSGEVLFVATATAGDDDMADRITRHQNERPSDWGLIEEPLLGDQHVDDFDAGALVIVDCLTLLVANLMFDGRTESETLDHVGQLARALAVRSSPTIAISNEVGLGIHPETELGREYRDLLGRANRTFADGAETSALVVAGKVLPLTDLDPRW